MSDPAVEDVPVHLDAQRSTPSRSDPQPRLALAAGAAALLLAPLVIWVVDVGALSLMAPLLAAAAVGIDVRYRNGIDYIPQGDPSVRTSTTGRLLGVAGLVVYLGSAAVHWAIGQRAQLQRFAELFFDPQFMFDALPGLLTEGLRVTLLLWVIALGIGTVLGLVLSLAAISHRLWVRLPALVYIDIFRGLPAIVTISLVGVGLPLSGLRPFGRNPLFYAGFALGLIATAYIAEIFRAGIQSIDKGQMEAARSVGMTYAMAMRVVIVPQGIRRVVPPLTNEAIALLKDTSLAFVIGMGGSGFFEGRDLFRVGQNLAQQFGAQAPLVAAALIYLALTIPLTRLTNYLDRRLREGRGGHQEETPDDELPAVITETG